MESVFCDKINVLNFIEISNTKYWRLIRIVENSIVIVNKTVSIDYFTEIETDFCKNPNI